MEAFRTAWVGGLSLSVISNDARLNLYVRYNILFFWTHSWDVSPVCDPRQ